MIKNICKFAVLTYFLSFSAQAESLSASEVRAEYMSASEIQAEKERLDAVCEIAREKRLAPEREKMISDCVEKKNKELSNCTRYYSDWGDRINYPNGNVKFAEYYDIPECEKAFEFRKQN